MTASKQTVGDSTGTVNRGVVIRIETAVLPIPLAKKNTAFSKLMARLDSSEEHRSGMAEARNWMAEIPLGLCGSRKVSAKRNSRAYLERRKRRLHAWRKGTQTLSGLPVRNCERSSGYQPISLRKSWTGKRKPTN
jgi:hypothetical protein